MKQPETKASSINTCYVWSLIFTFGLGMMNFGFCLVSWNAL